MDTVEKKFILAHPDVFYTNGVLVSFLEMIAEFLENGRLLKQHFTLKFVDGRPEQKVIDELKLNQNVAYCAEHLSFQNKMKELGDSDAILFIQRAAGGNFASDKFYNLLTLRRKILAVVPNPIVYSEIAQNESGIYVATLNDRIEISQAFNQMYHDWREEQMTLVYHTAA